MTEKIKKNAEVASEVQNNSAKENEMKKSETKEFENVFEMTGRNLPDDRIEVEQETLAAAMKNVLPVVPNKPVLPVQETVKLEIKDTAMKVTAFNPAQTISITLPVANPNGIEESVCVTARKFSQIVNALRKERLALFRKDEALMLVQGSGRFQIKVNLDYAQEFDFGEKKDDEPTDIALGASAVVGSTLGMVSSCQCTDDSRKQLNGVSVKVEKGRVEFAATDGRRLGVSSFECEAGVKWCGILPTASVAVLEKLCTEYAALDAAMQCTKKEITFAFGEKCTFKTKLVEGNYPNYMRVVPKKTDMFEILLPREEYMAVLKQTCMVNPDLHRRFSGDKVTIDSSDDMGNNVSNEMELASIPSNLDGSYIAFNANYAMGFLAKCEDESLDIFLTAPVDNERRIDTYTIHEGNALFLGMGMK